MDINLETLCKLERHSGRHLAINLTDVAIRTYATGKGHHQKPQTMVRIPRGVMKRLRWVIGDRCNTYADNDRKLIVIMRVNDGDYALSAHVVGKGGKDKTGTSDSAKTQHCNYPKWLQDATTGATVVFPHTITDDGLLVIDCAIKRAQ